MPKDRTALLCAGSGRNYTSTSNHTCLQDSIIVFIAYMVQISNDVLKTLVDKYMKTLVDKYTTKEHNNNNKYLFSATTYNTSSKFYEKLVTIFLFIRLHTGTW